MLQVVIDGAPCEMRKGSTICPGAGFHCSMRDSRNRVLGEASIFPQIGLWDSRKQPSQKLIGRRRCKVAEKAAAWWRFHA